MMMWASLAVLAIGVAGTLVLVGWIVWMLRGKR
jgi:hypothetical protein